MAIQWFPGHMHLTKKAIEERIKDIDVVIELLDARLPGSSANPMLAELTGAKPSAQGPEQAGPGRPGAHRRSGWTYYNSRRTRAPSRSTPATARRPAR